MYNKSSYEALLERIQDLEFKLMYNNLLKSFLLHEKMKWKPSMSEDLEFKLNIDKENDNVNHPSHYTWLKELCGIEVLDITRHLDFNTGNAVKYLLRAGRKDPKKTIEDLEKAIFYIKDKINMLKNENK